MLGFLEVSKIPASLGVLFEIELSLEVVGIWLEKLSELVPAVVSILFSSIETLFHAALLSLNIYLAKDNTEQLDREALRITELP